MKSVCAQETTESKHDTGINSSCSFTLLKTKLKFGSRISHTGEFPVPVMDETREFLIGRDYLFYI